MRKKAGDTKKNLVQPAAIQAGSSENVHSSSIVDQRPAAHTQRLLNNSADQSKKVGQLKEIQAMINLSPRTQQAAQLQTMADHHAAKQAPPLQRKPGHGVVQMGKKEQLAEADAKKAWEDVLVCLETAKAAADQAEKETKYGKAKDQKVIADKAKENAQTAKGLASSKASIANTLAANTYKRDARLAFDQVDSQTIRAIRAVRAIASLEAIKKIGRAISWFETKKASIEGEMDSTLNAADSCASAGNIQGATANKDSALEHKANAEKLNQKLALGQAELQKVSEMGEDADMNERQKVREGVALIDAKLAAIKRAITAIEEAAKGAEDIVAAYTKAEEAAKAAKRAEEAAAKALAASGQADEEAAQALEALQQAQVLAEEKAKIEAEAGKRAQTSRESYESAQANSDLWNERMTQEDYQEQAKKAPGSAADFIAGVHKKTATAKRSMEQDTATHEASLAAKKEADENVTAREGESETKAGLAADKAALKDKTALESETANKTKLEDEAAIPGVKDQVKEAVTDKKANITAHREIRALAGDELQAQQLLAIVPEVPDLKTLLTAIRANHPTDKAGTITDLIAAKGGATIPELAGFVTTVADKGNLTEATTFLTKALAMSGNPSIGDVQTFLTAAGDVPDVVKELGKLAGAVKATGTLTETTQLIATVGTNGNLSQISELMKKATGLTGTTAVSDVTTLVTTCGDVPNVARDLAYLLSEVGTKGTVPEVNALMDQVIAHHRGTVPLTRTLVKDSGKGANVCDQLHTIVEAVATNGTLTETTAMVKQAAKTLGADHISDVAMLIARDAAQNTPPRVQAFLTAIGDSQRDRFNRIHPKIPWFTQSPPPGGALANYSVHGNNFRCNRWNYFSQRHTYEAFDFGLADAFNSMWPPGTNPSDELNTAMAALSAPQSNNLIDGTAYISEAVGDVEVGVNESRYITHLMPLVFDERYTLAEVNAIKNLK